MTSDAQLNFINNLPVSEPDLSFINNLPPKEGNEVIYRENTNSITGAPAGLSSDEFEFLDNVQNQGRAAGDHFGFVDTGVGTVQNLAKSYIAGIVSGAANIATLDRSAVERTLESIGETRREFEPFDVLLQFSPTVEGRIAEIRVSERFGGEKTFEKEIARLREKLLVFEDIEQKTPHVIREMGLDKVEGNLVTDIGYDLGGGVQSLIQSIGLSLMTGNPSTATLVFAAQQKSRDYQEAREKGFSPEVANEASNLTAATTGAIEFIGTGAILKILKNSSKMARAAKGFVTEALEEGSQELSDILIKNDFGITDTDFSQGLGQVGYAAFIGGLVGAPVSVVLAQDPNISEQLNVEQDNAVELARAIENEVAQKPELQQEFEAIISNIVDQELLGLKADPEAAAQVQKIYADFVSGKDIDISNLSDGEKRFLDSLERVNVQRRLSERFFEDLDNADLSQELKNIIQRSRDRGTPIDKKEATAIAGLIEQGQEFETALDTVLEETALQEQSDLQSIISQRAGIAANALRAQETGRPIDQIIQEQEFATGVQGSSLAQGSQPLDPNKSFTRLEIARMTPEQREAVKQAKLAQATNKRHKQNIENKYSDSGLNKVVNTKRRKGKIRQKISDTMGDFGRMTRSALVPISTRLKLIDPKLKSRLRRFEFNLNKRIQADEEAIIPYLEKLRTLSDEDWVVLDFAMKNGDQDIIDQIATENNMVEEIAQIRKTLDDLYKRAESVGYDIGYRENFFPRHVTSPDGLVNFFAKSEAWSEIDQALRQKEIELGRPFTTEEKAHFINTLLRGYRTAQITLSKPGALKEREIDVVTPEINEFYNTSDQALIRYISLVNEAIETRKFFGKGSSTDLIENIEDSLGFFIMEELQKGTIDSTQSKELSDIIRARFNRGKMSTFWRVYKNFSYIDTMGSTTSALTQIGDLAFALHKSGVYKTLRALPRAIADRSEVTREDIGIEKIAQEFEDGSTSAKAVNQVFKLVGLDKVDAIGKEVLINSALQRYRKAAKNPTPEFRDSLQIIFEEETDSVIKDLQDGQVTENVKLLLFNELLDMQPVALSEMPEAYLKSGNGRIFYMLKTFTIKQLDIYRNEVFEEIRSGNTAKGLKNLIRLMSFFVMMNAGADYLKDLLLNRDTPPEDYVINNILRAFAISKFQIYTARREGLGTTAFKTIAPPFKIIDSFYKDVAKSIREGEIDINNVKSVSSIPIVGKLYYWWFGGGAEEKNQVSTLGKVSTL